MSDSDISQIISAYVKENLSPTEPQRNDITAKYKKLCGFLSGACFQSGSYARFTAINPVHDLDIIYVLPDRKIPDHPETVMAQLRDKLASDYSSDPTVSRIIAQTHSVTVVFLNHFNIDVVPAIELTARNEFGDPIYNVPEIAKFSHEIRTKIYDSEKKGMRTIGWIKSDPRGYVSSATILDMDTSGIFRKTVKVLKSWRHSCKQKYQDAFILKSFHLEQLCDEFLKSNPGTSLYSAIVGCFRLIEQRIDRPHYPDRADSTKKIDQYIQDKMTGEHHALIVTEQQRACEILLKMLKANSANDIIDRLDLLFTEDGGSENHHINAGGQRTVVTLHQPWA